MSKTISWETHIKSYFLEDDLEGYLKIRKVSDEEKRGKSYLAALRVHYWFPNEGLKDTENHIVLYRHDDHPFHPRINMQLKGPRAGKTNSWLDAQANSETPYEIAAPYDNKKKFRLHTLVRFSCYDKAKGWFFQYGVPHLLAVMVEQDFGYEISAGNRSRTILKSNTFSFDG